MAATLFFAVIHFPVQKLSDQLVASVNHTCPFLNFTPGPASFVLPMGISYEEASVGVGKTNHLGNIHINLGLLSLLKSGKSLGFKADLSGGTIQGDLWGLVLPEHRFSRATFMFKGVEVRNYTHTASKETIDLNFDLDGTCRFEPGHENASGDLVLKALSIDLKHLDGFTRMGVDTLSFNRVDLSLGIENGVVSVEKAVAKGPMLGLTLTGRIGADRSLDLKGWMTPTPSMVSKLSRVADVRELFGKASGKGIAISFTGTWSAPKLVLQSKGATAK